MTAGFGDVETTLQLAVSKVASAMPQFWWVNHNQTARQEVDGEYLWSPKTESGGARSQFYNNMRRASPGDVVLSFSSQALRYVGRVTEFAFTAPKPEEFGKTGLNWSAEGWLLPVYWVPLEPPVYPKSIIGRLGPLLPKQYSPIQQVSGNGNQKAYLAAISEAAFDVIIENSTFNQWAMGHGGGNSLTYPIVNEWLEDAVERTVEADKTLDATVKSAVIEARKGQGQFRSNVMAREPSCRLTGITNPSLLIASHIKPWRLCKTANERLDAMNGLMLTPDADLLFDRGFISFQDDGEVLVSPRVDRDDLNRLGFHKLSLDRFGVSEAPTPWITERSPDTQRAYMSYHREQVFIA
jgi:putative restriction endonuclease